MREDCEHDIIQGPLRCGSKPSVRSAACRHLMLATVYVLLLTAGELANAMERRLFDISGGPFDMSGFYDIDTRELVIPLRFERVRKFSEGLAAVRDKGLWGYIDMTGAWAITPRFELADDFHNGLAAIEAGKFIGVIDRTGKIVIEPQFARVEPFTSDIVIATEGEVGPRGVYPGFETVGARSVSTPGEDSIRSGAAGSRTHRCGSTPSIRHAVCFGRGPEKAAFQESCVSTAHGSWSRAT
jgi:WG containing repeat